MTERERNYERRRQENNYALKDLSCCLNCKHSGGIFACLICYEGAPAKRSYPVEWNGICDKYELEDKS